jgi:hypothetical protein
MGDARARFELPANDHALEILDRSELARAA